MNGVIGNYRGDWRTLGGVIVVDGAGTNVLFEYRQEQAGDHCPPEDLLLALGIHREHLSLHEERSISWGREMVPSNACSSLGTIISGLSLKSQSMCSEPQLGGRSRECDLTSMEAGVSDSELASSFASLAHLELVDDMKEKKKSEQKGEDE